MFDVGDVHDVHDSPDGYPGLVAEIEFRWKDLVTDKKVVLVSEDCVRSGEPAWTVELVVVET
jgi:hypothetical protein